MVDPHRSTVPASQHVSPLLIRLVAEIRERQPSLEDTWMRRLRDVATEPPAPAVLAVDASPVFNCFLDAVQTGRADRLRLYASVLSRRLSPVSEPMEGVLGVILSLRDVIARHVASPQTPAGSAADDLDRFEIAANHVIAAVATTLLEERERAISEREEQLRVPWAPVLPLRDRLLVLPVVGLMDVGRPRHLTEQVLVSIHRHRARVLVLDLGGVPVINRDAAFELTQTIDAARLLGGTLILTGLSPAAAEALRSAGVDPGRLPTMLDLESGVQEAERLLGLSVISEDSLPPSPAGVIGAA